MYPIVLYLYPPGTGRPNYTPRSAKVPRTMKSLVQQEVSNVLPLVPMYCATRTAEACNGLRGSLDGRRVSFLRHCMCKHSQLYTLLPALLTSDKQFQTCSLLLATAKHQKDIAASKVRFWDVKIAMSQTSYSVFIKEVKMLRIPHCLDNRLIDGGKVVSPTVTILDISHHPVFYSKLH
jgi:hypothetical protein